MNLMGRKVIHTIDTYAGEPSRIILGQDLRVQGDTMRDRMAWVEENMLWLRDLALREPRGYPAMCGMLIMPPVNPGSAYSQLILEHGGVRAMSGSNSICAVTALVETGAIDVPANGDPIRVDTPVGTIEIYVSTENGRVKDVEFVNVSSFVVDTDVEFELPEYGKVKADIVFGGQFYVQADIAEFGMHLGTDNVPAIVRAASVLHKVAADTYSVEHPVNPDINVITLPLLYEKSDVDGVDYRHAVVLPSGVVDLDNPETWTGSIDRSPCGTGTSGRIARRAQEGALGLGETYVSESLIGTQFRGTYDADTAIGAFKGVSPRIAGRAFITGFNTIVLEPDDPNPHGYVLGDIWNTAAQDAH